MWLPLMCDAKVTVTAVNMMYKAFITAFLPIFVSSTILNQRTIPQASFEVEDMQTRIEAPAGTTVRLSCPVRHIGTRNILWLKDNDDILSIGEMVWIGHDRFSVSLEHGNNTAPSVLTYTLTITDVTADDRGFYRCEITSRRLLRSPPIELVVEEGEDEIPIGTVHMTDVTFVDLNDQIVLNCRMPRGVDGPLSWFKSGLRIVATDADTDNSRTTVTIDQVDATSSTGASSTLTISQARRSDAGHYVCRGILGETPLLGATSVHVLIPGLNNRRRQGQ